MAEQRSASAACGVRMMCTLLASSSSIAHRVARQWLVVEEQQGDERTGQGGRARPGSFSALAFAPFRWFWIGQSISVVGDRVYMVALPFLVFDLGGDARAVGRMFAAFSIPQLLFLLFGGVIVDRVPRRLLMIVADVLRAALLAAVLLLIAGEALRLGHVYAMAALFGLASAFFLPATFSIVPELLPRERLAAANSLRAFSQELAAIVGPPLGGLLVSLGGLSLALGFDLATFLVGIGFLLLVRVNRQRSGGKHSGAGYLPELAAGFGYVVGSTWLWVTIVLFAAINVFVSGVIAVVLPVLAESSLGGATALGWLLSAMGAGALASTLLISRLIARGRRGLLAYGGVGVAGLALLGLSFAPGLLGGMLFMALLGASLTLFGVVWESTVQELVPADMLGRVISIDMLGSFALLPLGSVLLGQAVTLYGVSPVIAAAGMATVAAVAIGLSVPEIRRLP